MIYARTPKKCSRVKSSSPAFEPSGALARPSCLALDRWLTYPWNQKTLQMREFLVVHLLSSHHRRKSSRTVKSS